uniref:Uncharacterized protein n=1 Tax=Panagrolaimus davidi TaxID=227884 RepID=A0A914QGM2_9BILA
MKPFGTPLPTPNPDYNNPFYKFSINDLYLKNLTIPYNFNIDDGSLNLNVQWDPYNWYEFFVNDDRFISNTNITTCCTSFKPIQVAPTKFPKCTNFKISSKIYYTANNSFLVTTNANFVLTDNSFISAKGEYGQTYEPEQIQESWLYAVNNFACQKSFGFSQYCYYSLNEKDKTLFIQIYPASEDTKFLFLAGQIILRDNQTLISDGIPFSTSTMCTNFTRISKIYHDDKEYSITAVSELCCNSFVIPTPPPPTPQKPVAKIGQKCTALTTKYIDIRNTTISARLEISSFNSTNNILKIENLHISTPINYEFSDITFDAFDSKGGERDINGSSVVFTYGNTPYDIGIELGERSWDIIISGIIDNGSFVAFDGQLFDQNDHKCFESSLGEFFMK